MSIVSYGLGPSGGGVGGYSNMFTVAVNSQVTTGSISSSVIASTFLNNYVSSVLTVSVNGSVKQIISNEISN